MTLEGGTPCKMVHCGRLAEDGGYVCTERSTAVATHENVADQLRTVILMMPVEEGREWY